MLRYMAEREVVGVVAMNVYSRGIGCIFGLFNMISTQICDVYI